MVGDYIKRDKIETETCTYDAKGNLVAWEVINGWTGDHKDTYVYDEYGNVVKANVHTYYGDSRPEKLTWKLLYCPNGISKALENHLRDFVAEPGECRAVNP